MGYLNYRKKRVLMGWIFALPVLAGVTIFNFVPMVYSGYFSFTQWDAVSEPHWIGLLNYKYMFTEDPHFFEMLKATVYYSFGSVALSMICGLGLALLVSKKMKGIHFFRAVYFLPYITSIIAVSVVWRWIFNPSFGLLNYLLSLVGVKGPGWTRSEIWAMPSVIIVAGWYSMGYNMILFLAGLQNIPQQFYDAAKVDGANRWQQFTKITLPLLSPTTFFVLVVSIIGAFQAFALIFVLTEGGPGYSTSVIVYYLWENAFRYFRMGYGCAIAMFLLMIVALITLIQWKGSKYWVHYA